MVKYACTPGTASLCYKLLRWVTALTLLLVLSCLTVSAQDGRRHGDSASARLEITAKIVPSVICVPRPPRHRFDDAVSYDVPADQMELSVTERVRVLDEKTVLKTVTFVAK